MTTFDPIQFSSFAGASEMPTETASQPPVLDREAAEAFRQAYERPAEPSVPAELAESGRAVAPRPPHSTARPANLPPATPETLARTVRENLALTQELPQPVELPRSVALAQLPVAQPQVGQARVVTAEPPVHEGFSKFGRAAALRPPHSAERPADLPPATPETLAQAVRENLALTQELSQPVELPRSVEQQQPSVAQPRVVMTEPLSAERPADLPPATPETLARAVRDNLMLAKELPQPVEFPRTVAPSQLPVEQPQVGQPRVMTPEPLAHEALARFGRAVAPRPPLSLERPADLPSATPETLAQAVRDNLTLAKELPPPVVLPCTVAPSQLPVEHPQVGQPRVVTSEPPVQAEIAESGRAVAPLLPPSTARPVELPPATSETLSRAVRENLALTQELTQPVGLSRTVELPQPVELPVVGKRARLTPSAEEPVPQALPEVIGVASPVQPEAAVAPAAPAVAGVAANVSAAGPRTAEGIVLEAASAVADTLLVSPNLMRGDGEIVVQLKPEVLDGSRLRIRVAGHAMQIEFEPVTADVARLLAASQEQLVSHLAERIPTFEFAVSVLSGGLSGRRVARKSVAGAERDA